MLGVPAARSEGYDAVYAAREHHVPEQPRRSYVITAAQGEGGTLRRRRVLALAIYRS